jgi:hypothetical protein
MLLSERMARPFMQPSNPPVAGESKVRRKFPSRVLMITVSPDRTARFTRGNSRRSSVTVDSMILVCLIICLIAIIVFWDRDRKKFFKNGTARWPALQQVFRGALPRQSRFRSEFFVPIGWLTSVSAQTSGAIKISAGPEVPRYLGIRGGGIGGARRFLGRRGRVGCFFLPRNLWRWSWRWQSRW